MGFYVTCFHCVELVSEISEITSYPTRWGAAKRCHELNECCPQERWTVESIGVRYVPDYREVDVLIRRKLRIPNDYRRRSKTSFGTHHESKRIMQEDE